MKKRPKKRGGRFDGHWLRDETSALSQFMPYLMPNRADNEAYLKTDIDVRPLDRYLAKKNAGRTRNKYTYFHVFLAAMVKCLVLRPQMNRFVSGNRLYMRDYISVSFMVKKRFKDNSEEGIAFKKYNENDTIDTLHKSILEEIYQCRREDVRDNSSNMIAMMLRLPCWLLNIAMKFLFFLDRKGKVPYDLIKTDPNYSSIFLSNVGSIGLDSGYHHLNNWGSNSIFCMVGKRHLAPEWHEDGSYTVYPVISLGITVDERIGDGFYFARTIRLLNKILEQPEILEQPFSTPVEY